MPDLTKGHTFDTGEVVTAASLNSLVDDATINNDAITADMLSANSVTDSKISSSAVISLSKLEKPTDGKIIVGRASDGAATAVSLSGDATIIADGTLTIEDGAITAAKLAAGAASPAGVITQFAGAAAPTGWLLCNGAEYSETGDYADLFAVIASTYNTGGETEDYFRVPDLKGRIPIGAGQQTNTKHSTVDLTDCATTDTDATVTTGDTSSLVVGMEVRGAGIPTGATIDSIVVDTSFELSVVATATADPVTLTFGPLYLGTGTDFALAAVGGAEDHKVTIAEMPSHTHTVSYGQSLTKRGDSAWEASGYSGTGPTLSTGGDDPHNILQPYIVLNYIIKT